MQRFHKTQINIINVCYIHGVTSLVTLCNLSTYNLLYNMQSNPPWWQIMSTWQ